MSVLQSELKDLRTQFEESLNSHENGKRSLTEQVRELNQQSEHAQQEVRTFMCAADSYKTDVDL